MWNKKCIHKNIFVVFSVASVHLQTEFFKTSFKIEYPK